MQIKKTIQHKNNWQLIIETTTENIDTFRYIVYEEMKKDPNQSTERNIQYSRKMQRSMSNTDIQFLDY